MILHANWGTVARIPATQRYLKQMMLCLLKINGHRIRRLIDYVADSVLVQLSMSYNEGVETFSSGFHIPIVFVRACTPGAAVK